jgi:ABC-type multidrug transport system ATPase subunit
VPPAPLIHLDNVDVRRNGALILRELELVVEAREIVAITGPNGSGKTTLLRLISTLLAPTGGSARILDVDADDRTKILTVRHRIGMVGHSPAVWPELSLAENISVLPGLACLGGEAIHNMLAEVGLARAADRRADRASLGMLRRVEFARLRLLPPELLLLDEAHAGLDAGAAALVADTARQVQEKDGAVVLVSHEIGRMSGAVTRTLALRDGRLESS